MGGQSSLALEGRFLVPASAAGTLLDRFVREALGTPPWSKVRSLIERGHVTVDGVRETRGTFPLAGGETIEVGLRPIRVEHGPGATNDGARGRAIEVLHVDSQVIVVDKPSGLSSEPYDAQEKEALSLWLTQKFRAKVHVVHRLDKETSGVLVFARTIAARDHLKNQFRFRTTGRVYMALVHGRPRSRTIHSRLVRDRGDGLRGSTDNPRLGRDATTRVELCEEFEGASLVECQLETGRTHQIRIHLAEAGHPLLGERVYSRGFTGPLFDAPRVMLHARSLAFDHPTGGQRVAFERAPPNDFGSLLEELRGGVRASTKRGTVSR